MSDRYRTIAFLFYPETAPVEFLLDRIKESHVPAFVSPLHQPDEKEKKEHYHVLLMFDTQMSVKYLHDLVLFLGGANGYFVHPPKRQYARYLLHLDDPDKEQFQDTVISLNGADYTPYFFSNEDIESGVKICNILHFIRDNNITNFRQLVEALTDFESIYFVSRNVIFFNTYLKS